MAVINEWGLLSLGFCSETISWILLVVINTHGQAPMDLVFCSIPHWRVMHNKALGGCFYMSSTSAFGALSGPREWQKSYLKGHVECAVRRRHTNPVSVDCCTFSKAKPTSLEQGFLISSCQETMMIFSLDDSCILLEKWEVKATQQFDRRFLWPACHQH